MSGAAAGGGDWSNQSDQSDECDQSDQYPIKPIWSMWVDPIKSIWSIWPIWWMWADPIKPIWPIWAIWSDWPMWAYSIKSIWSMLAEPIKTDQINVINVSRTDQHQINLISATEKLFKSWQTIPILPSPCLPFYLTKSKIKSETCYFFRKVFLYNVKKEIYFGNNLSYLSHYTVCWINQTYNCCWNRALVSWCMKKFLHLILPQKITKSRGLSGRRPRRTKSPLGVQRPRGPRRP